MQIVQLVSTLVRFYEFLILAYVLMSWIPVTPGGLIDDIRAVLATACEPFLALFRRILPPMGGIDFSPVIAVLALNLVTNLVIRVLI